MVWLSLDAPDGESRASSPSDLCRNDGFVQFSGAARNGTLPNLALMPSILLLTSGVFFGCLIELPFAVLCVLGRGIN